jgi:hypothetical protein
MGHNPDVVDLWVISPGRGREGMMGFLTLLLTIYYEYVKYDYHIIHGD